MADYIYLLETRLSPAQQGAIGTVRTIAREHDLTVFLTGGAVRDLTGGGSVRDLDMTVQGDASRLKQPLQDAGAELTGEDPAAQRLFFSFPGGVRVELSTAMCVTFPKPGQPQYEPGNLTDDLRSRDFTANAMAISLNEGSYGLLMDPLNGVADIENRELRLVSNYGFIEEPSRLVRAARLTSRLGWQMEERTRQRYETAKEENYAAAMSEWHRGYELEEIFHEEDPVRIMRSLEAEGWLARLSPVLTSAKANPAALTELAEKQGALQVQGILSQPAAVAFPLVTAKLSPAEAADVKKLFARQGFAREIDSLEGRSKDFATRLAAKDTAAPSAFWKLLHSSDPNLVLAVSFNSRSGPVQSRLKTFLTESANARQRMPHTLMQEMRITPDLPGYTELVDRLFFELMDNHLSTSEELRAFLEPYSPPAPPPPVNLRRARAKKEARPGRGKGKKGAAAEVPAESSPETEETTVAAEEEATGVAQGLMEPGTLTGPGRGTEPEPEETLVGKVAPLASTEAAPAKAALSKKAARTEPAELHGDVPAKRSSGAKDAAAKDGVTKDVAAKKEPAAGKQPVKSAPAKASPVKAAAPASKAPVRQPAGKVPATPVVAKKSATGAVLTKSANAKTGSQKAAPSKAPAKKTSASKAAEARKPAKSIPAPAAKKPAAAAKKTIASKKSAPAKKAAPPARKSAAATKKSVPAARKAPAKKAAAKKGRR